jgi:hypothetical protein
MNARTFSTLSSNRFWDTLQAANQKHVTAQQSYLQLMKDLEAQRVGFQDIRSFLLNEAKRAGLLQKNYWNGKAMSYPSKAELKKRKDAWFVALGNFMSWVNYNYAGGYSKQVTTEMRKRQKAASQAQKSEKKSTAITRTKSEDGQIKESRTEVIESTTDMSAPVTDSLTDEQVRSIVLSNLDIIAEYALNKGASKEWNALALALGKPEDVLQEDMAASA